MQQKTVRWPDPLDECSTPNIPNRSEGRGGDNCGKREGKWRSYKRVKGERKSYKT